MFFSLSLLPDVIVVSAFIFPVGDTNLIFVLAGLSISISILLTINIVLRLCGSEIHCILSPTLILSISTSSKCKSIAVISSVKVASIEFLNSALALVKRFSATVTSSHFSTFHIHPHCSTASLS